MLSINKHNLPIFSVSELSFSLKKSIEEQFSYVRIRGEISGFKLATSGHAYFALKDNDALLDAVGWKGIVQKIPFSPEDGMEVICSGKITTYPGRSKYQLVIESMELAGTGALLALLEKRKQKLMEEGLFDLSRKKPLPFLPRRIGIITSPTGAVIKDMIHRLEDRFPLHILVWPCLVQGEGAKEQITAGIHFFNQLPIDSPLRPDLIIVARGGGSIEDLWAFNEEMVVRAAADSLIPLISAIGHETDTTLIDFASDLRAPTPTAAAELAVPVKEDLIEKILSCHLRLAQSLKRLLDLQKLHLENVSQKLLKQVSFLDQKTQRLDEVSLHMHKNMKFYFHQQKAFLDNLSHKIKHPQYKLELMTQQFKTAEDRLNKSYHYFLYQKNYVLGNLSKSLHPLSLQHKIEAYLTQNMNWGKEMTSQLSQMMQLKNQKLSHHGALLKSLSYENVLDRGFALVKDEHHHMVTSSRNIQQGKNLKITFKDGDLKVTSC